MNIIATRHHDISIAHRAPNDPGPCHRIHGHNLRVTFHVARQDNGSDFLVANNNRVLDFSIIKSKLCGWLEAHWDHKFLMWDQDPIFRGTPNFVENDVLRSLFFESIYLTDFDTSTENMALYLLNVVGPLQLVETGCVLVKVEVSETRKCGAIAEL